MTSAAIRELANRGRLTFTDAISDHLPDYRAGSSITIGQLVDHTSGVPDWSGFPDAREMEQQAHTLSELVQWISEAPLLFAPGESRQYSNSGYVILARIVEVASGDTYGAFLHNAFFSPRGMANTGHTSEFDEVPELAVGYVPSHTESGLARAGVSHPSIFTGSGSVHSTSGDLFLWLRSLPTSYWDQGERLGRPVTFAGGFVPGFGAWMDMYSEEDVTIVLLANINNGAFRHIVRDLGAIVLGEPYELPKIPRPIDLDSVQLHAIVGRYDCDPGFGFTVEAQGDEPVVRWMHRSEPQPLWPVSSTRFFYPQDWATIEIGQTEEGRAIGLTFDAGQPAQCERIGPK